MATRPTVTARRNNRSFACFPAAVMVFVINEAEEFLVLSQEPDNWVLVGGGIEDNESILEGALRESFEELGNEVQLNPLGVIHTMSFHYDAAVQNMISVMYLMKYCGGKIIPGDDLTGAVFDWWNMEKIRMNIEIISRPNRQLWLFERALKLYQLIKDENQDLEYATAPGMTERIRSGHA